MKYKEDKKKAEKVAMSWWLFDIPEDQPQEKTEEKEDNSEENSEETAE
jgi:hypothetical protein